VTIAQVLNGSDDLPNAGNVSHIKNASGGLLTHNGKLADAFTVQCRFFTLATLW
jgi:hypothetical protein